MRKLLVFIGFSISVQVNAQTAEEYYITGNEKTSNKNYESSIEDYGTAIKINPKYTDAYFNRGTSKLYLKDYKGAITDFDRTLELKPDFLKAHTNRGIAKLKINDNYGAIEDFDFILKIDPGNASTYFMRGQVKLQSGDKKGGCFDLSKANDLGDTRAQKYLSQYCADLTTENKHMESLRLDWPDNEGWKIASNQADNERKVIELLKNNETFDNWTEIGTMMTYPSLKNAPLDAAMNVMLEQAKKNCPSARLAFIESDERAKYPWIIFKIECSTSTPESQVWQILMGANETYINFRAVKEKSVPEDLKNKWVKFFKTASIVAH